jgi:hypothetical protein
MAKWRIKPKSAAAAVVGVVILLVLLVSVTETTYSGLRFLAPRTASASAAGAEAQHELVLKRLEQLDNGRFPNQLASRRLSADEVTQRTARAAELVRAEIKKRAAAAQRIKEASAAKEAARRLQLDRRGPAGIAVLKRLEELEKKAGMPAWAPGRAAPPRPAGPGAGEDTNTPQTKLGKADSGLPPSMNATKGEK